jgi:hypothetical protein
MRYPGFGGSDSSMTLPAGFSLRLAPPLAWDGRLFVPIVRKFSLSDERGGVCTCTPVALLVGEGDAWSFVSLDPETTRECLEELELPPAIPC